MKEILLKQLTKINLSEQTKFRLDEISEIENYFYQEINQRKSCSKKLSKYVTAFDYIDKILIALSATSGGIFICSFTSLVAAPIGFASAIFTLNFFFNRNSQKIIKYNKKQKKKHDKIFMLAKSKLNSIETLISQALIDMDISHEEFVTILKKKDKYEKMNKI